MEEKPWGKRSRLRSVSDAPSDFPQLVQPEFILKFVVLGGESVGKTTFVKYFAEHPFPLGHMQTVGIDMTVVPYGVYAGRQMYLHFFDVSSAEQHEADSPSLQLALQDASGILILFDATEYSTFVEVDEINSILKYLYASSNGANTIRPPVLLLAHKADLMTVERRPLLTAHDMLAFVDNNNMIGYRWTSLQNRKSVDEAIQALVEAALLATKNTAVEPENCAGTLQSLLKNTYSWPNMSGIGGAKTRINAQLIKPKTFVNIDVNNGDESPQTASPYDFSMAYNKLKEKRDILLKYLDEPESKDTDNSNGGSIEETNLEISLITATLKLYEESKHKQDKMEEFRQIATYVLDVD